MIINTKRQAEQVEEIPIKIDEAWIGPQVVQETNPKIQQLNVTEAYEKELQHKLQTRQERAKKSPFMKIIKTLREEIYTKKGGLLDMFYMPRQQYIKYVKTIQSKK